MINNKKDIENGIFYNTDEELFQDSNRPRDEFWIKIKPWIQTEKLDWRGANKNIFMSSYIVKWAVVAQRTADGQALVNNVAYLKKKYEKSDFSFITDFGYNYDQIGDFVKWNEAQGEIWDAFVDVEDGEVVIRKRWTYIIQAYSDFLYPAWYDSSVSYQYKEFVTMGVRDNKTDPYLRAVQSQSRACWNPDWLMAWEVTYATAGTRLNVLVAHTYTQSVLCNVALNFYRLS